MLVSTFMSRLAQGPVGDLAIGGAGAQQIQLADQVKLLPKVQEALTQLHTRFPLAIKTIVLQTIDGRFEYPLWVKHAQADTSEPMADKFIIDTLSAKFTGDVLAIEHVLDNDRNELGLNDRRDVTSWFTVAYDTLSMDYPVSGQTYFVQYRGDHAVLNPDSGTFATQQLRIPTTLEAALIAKVGYEIFCTQTGESAAIKAQELEGKYNAICNELEAMNALNSSVVENRDCQFKRNGWA